MMISRWPHVAALTAVYQCVCRDRCQAKVEKKLVGKWNVAFDPAAVWRSTNTTTASHLLWQFFRFYAEFPAKVKELCPLIGESLERAKSTDQSARLRLVRPEISAGFLAGRVKPRDANTPLVVQDPVELNRNVACKYSKQGLDRFRQCCRKATITPLSGMFTE